MFVRSVAEIEHDLRTQPSAFWQSRGEQMALNLFHRVAESVPAYANFLHKHGIRHQAITTIEQFRTEVPLTTKKNYIQQYSPQELSWPVALNGGAVIYGSSGTSGQPTYWRRNVQHDVESTLFHEIILRDSFAIEHTNTLFIVCFALGIHVAGYITAVALNNLMHQYKTISLATPGSKKDDIVNVLLNQGHEYERVVLVGYPPLIRDVVVESLQKNFPWKKLKAGFLFAAQGFSESWRDHLCSLVGGYAETPVVNIYGSADTGPLGFETASTLHVRKNQPQLNPDLFTLPSGQRTVPFVYRYFPELRYFEHVDQELVVTADNGQPLIRYNIHDLGGVLKADEIVVQYPELAKDSCTLPYVYLYGRSNYSVIFYGANIYPENVQSALEQTAVMPFATGRFFLQVVEDEQHNPNLHIHIEQKTDLSEENKTELQSVVVNTMLSQNREFVVVYKEMGNQDKVFVQFHAQNDSEFAQRSPKKYIDR